MKKLTVTLLVMACLLMMAGCGVQNTSTEASTSKTTSDTTKVTEAEQTTEATEVTEAEETTESTTITESEAGSELMTIEDIFFIEDHGVILTGIINQGTINTDDVITVNGETYTVFMIDAVDPDTNTPGNVDSASEGMSVALHLSTMDSSLFAQGDVVEICEE